MRACWPVVLALGVFACDGRGAVCDRLGELCAGAESELRLDLSRASVLSADLDGDGELDLITAVPGGGLAVSWGRQTRAYWLFAGGVPDAAVADVDEDGDLDLLFVTPETAMLRVLENRGGRRLVEGPVVAVPGRPNSVWAGALAGEALAVVVASGASGGISIYSAELRAVEHIAAGEELVAVEAGDLDGDGRLDVVAADRAGDALFVALNRGAGFAAARRVASGPAPEYLELYDLDGDGSLDALTHGRTHAAVWLQAGDGSGGLAAPRGLEVQERPSEGFAAHRDADGGRWIVTADGVRVVASEVDDEDRVTRRVFGGGFGLAQGVASDGDGVLARGSAYNLRYSLASGRMLAEVWRSAHAGSLEPMVFGDFDGDGRLDLAVNEVSDEVSMFVGDGHTRWTTAPGFTVPQYVTDMAAGDVTGDGVLDLAIGDSDMAVWIAIGRGDGRFTPGPRVTLAIEPSRLLGGFDPDGDGAAAVAVASPKPDEPGLQVLRFDAAGVLVAQTQPITTGNAYVMASADLDEDGRDELVALMRGDADELRLEIVMGGADGLVRSRPLTDVPIASNARTLVLGDHDGDGTVDGMLLTQSTITRLPDIGADPPPPPVVMDMTYEFSGADAARLADVDGDGGVDLVYCSYSEAGVVLIGGDGALTLGPALEGFFSNCAVEVEADGAARAATLSERGVSVLAPGVAPGLADTHGFVDGPGPQVRLETGDIDADGRTDLVVGDEATQTHGGFGVLWGDESGPRRAVWNDAVSGIAGIAVAPLDERPGDEIVGVSAGDVRVWTYVDGAVQRRGDRVSLGLYGIHAVAVRTDAEGTREVVVLGERPADTLRIVGVQERDGALAEAPTLLWDGPGEATAPALAIADLDGDEVEDIAVLAGGSTPVQVIWGDAGGAVGIDGVAMDARRIAAADLDGDGAAELVIATAAGIVRVDLRGRKIGAPAPLSTVAAGAHLVLADVEGDGVVDVFGGGQDGLTGLLRGPGGEAHVRIEFGARPWSVVRFAELDGDGILDLVGLREGQVITRRSGSPAR